MRKLVIKQLKTAKRQFAKRAGWLVLAVVVIGLATVLGWQNHSWQSLRRALTLASTHQPERYSELYFNNQTQLPTQIAPQTPQRFSFHLTNHEAQPATYQYRIWLSLDGMAANQIQAGQLSLPNNGAADVPASFMLPAAHQSATVTVELIGRGQYIQFRSQS